MKYEAVANAYTDVIHWVGVMLLSWLFREKKTLNVGIFLKWACAEKTLK